MSRQTKISGSQRSTFQERFLSKHESWFKKQMAIEEKQTTVGLVRAFSLRNATIDQKEAVRLYARRFAKKNMRGFVNWMKWSEKTYYDILKVISPRKM